MELDFSLSGRSDSRPLELVDVEGELEGGAELQAHVFHHHVAAQQQQCPAIDFLRPREVKRKTTVILSLKGNCNDWMEYLSCEIKFIEDWFQKRLYNNYI